MGKKFAEQSDEKFSAKNILGKERERFPLKDRKYINQFKKSLTRKCMNSWPESLITKVKDYAKRLQEVQTSCAWRSDSTTIFKSFANGTKVTYRNVASKMFSGLLNSVFCILLNENYCLCRLNYPVMNPCIEFKINWKQPISFMFTRNKSFTCFFNNLDWSLKPSCSQNCVFHRPWKALKALKTYL